MPVYWYPKFNRFAMTNGFQNSEFAVQSSELFAKPFGPCCIELIFVLSIVLLLKDGCRSQCRSIKHYYINDCFSECFQRYYWAVEKGMWQIFPDLLNSKSYHFLSDVYFELQNGSVTHAEAMASYFKYEESVKVTQKFFPGNDPSLLFIFCSCSTSLTILLLIISIAAEDGCIIHDKVSKVLKAHDCNADNTLFAQSICPDEINHEVGDITNIFSGYLGEVFHMGGLAGIPFTGKTGFGAFKSHVPDGKQHVDTWSFSLTFDFDIIPSPLSCFNRWQSVYSNRISYWYQRVVQTWWVAVIVFDVVAERTIKLRSTIVNCKSLKSTDAQPYTFLHILHILV